MKYLISLSLVLLSLQTKAQFPDSSSSSESEELSYDDLISELSAKQKHQEIKTQGSAFDQIQIHGGVGVINSFSTFRIQGQNVARYQNGMQLSMGVDLFSPHWMTELSWRNFGLNRQENEEHSLREFGLKIGYKDRLEGPWSYRVQSGLAQRDLKITDSGKNLEILASTPAVIGSLGAILQMTPHASLGFEAGGRAPLLDRTADQGSLDLSLEFKISL